jgi:hypothetical protein
LKFGPVTDFSAGICPPLPVRRRSDIYICCKQHRAATMADIIPIVCNDMPMQLAIVRFLIAISNQKKDEQKN